jgi:non-ribosomal peptide synthetase component E (peptide arylation enzyme)
VARVVAFIPDLLFGSNVVGALRAAGHEVDLASGLDSAVDADVVVVDLTADAADRIAAVAELDLGAARTLAFYSHVDADVRAAAEHAGFDLVVPRSRMNREGPDLVTRLADADG